MKLAIIIPTYNEKENITSLISEIFANLKNSKVDANVVVVDDNSPDGTRRLVESVSKKNKKVFLVNRPAKLGIGSAYVAGFRFSLKKLSPDILMTMDSDFSHDPKYILDLVKGMNNHDIMIGSRYVKHGGVRNWGIIRRIISKGANTLARTVLGLNTKDCTAGFKCFKRNVIESINFDKLSSKGYSFILEMLYTCNKLRFKIGETPIIFVNRKLGKSKITRKEMYNTALLLLKLRFGRK